MSEQEKNTPEDGLQNAAESSPGTTDSAGEASSGEDLHLMLEDARNKADEHWNALLRTQAEIENLRRRHGKELENAHKFALEKFVNELLPVRDSMEMGLTAAQDDGVDIAKIREGLDLTLKMMASAMEKFEVREISPLGQKFNPELHQAMAMQESADAEPNTVLVVVQKGYTLNDRLVRPAMVIVAKAAAVDKQSNSPAYDAETRSGSGQQLDEQA